MAKNRVSLQNDWRRRVEYKKNRQEEQLRTAIAKEEIKLAEHQLRIDKLRRKLYEDCPTEEISQPSGCNLSEIGDLQRFINHKEEDEMGNVDSRKKIIYHLDDPYFNIPTKKDGIYIGLERFWGNIITNKANRSNEHFAIMFETNGRFRTNLSHADYQWYKNLCEHVYIHRFDTEKFQEVIDNIPKMDYKQCRDALVELLRNPALNVISQEVFAVLIPKLIKSRHTIWIGQYNELIKSLDIQR